MCCFRCWFLASFGLFSSGAWESEFFKVSEHLLSFLIRISGQNPLSGCALIVISRLKFIRFASSACLFRHCCITDSVKEFTEYQFPALIRLVTGNSVSPDISAYGMPHVQVWILWLFSRICNRRFSPCNDPLHFYHFHFIILLFFSPTKPLLTVTRALSVSSAVGGLISFFRSDFTIVAKVWKKFSWHNLTGFVSTTHWKMSFFFLD